MAIDSCWTIAYYNSYLKYSKIQLYNQQQPNLSSFQFPQPDEQSLMCIFFWKISQLKILHQNLWICYETIFGENVTWITSPYILAASTSYSLYMSYTLCLRNALLENDKLAVKIIKCVVTFLWHFFLFSLPSNNKEQEVKPLIYITILQAINHRMVFGGLNMKNG